MSNSPGRPGRGIVQVVRFHWGLAGVLLLGCGPEVRPRPEVSRAGLERALPVDGSPTERSGVAFDGRGAYRAPLRAGLTPWVTSTPMPLRLRGHRALRIGRRLHVIGGCTTLATSSDDCTQVTARTFHAELLADGTVGPWVDGPALPSGRERGSLIRLGDVVHYLGGTAPSAIPVERLEADVLPDDTLGPWRAVAAPELDRNFAGLVAVRGRLALLGGKTQQESPQSTALVADIGPGGAIGTFTAGTPFPMVRGPTEGVALGELVVSLGGYAGGAQAEVYVSRLGANGQLGAWRATTPLPRRLGALAALVRANHVYVYGGFDSTAVQIVDQGWVSALLDDGELGPWIPLPRLSGIRDGLQLVEGEAHLYALGGKTVSGQPTAEVALARFDDSALPTAAAGVSRPGPALPGDRAHPLVIGTGASVYSVGGCAVGGYDSVCTSFPRSVLRAPVGADGGVGAWVDVGVGLQAGRHRAHGFERGGGLYLFGGVEEGTGDRTDVLRAPLLSDGGVGSFVVTGTATSPSRYGQVAHLDGDGVVLTGGNDGINYQRWVHRAALLADGGVGPWVDAGSMLSARMEHVAFAHRGISWVFGGWDGALVSAVERFGPDDVRVASPPLDEGLAVATSLQYQGHVWLLGGDNPLPDKPMATVGAWLPDGGLSALKLRGPLVVDRRRRHGAALVGHTAFLVGGAQQPGTVRTTELVPLRVPVASGAFARSVRFEADAGAVSAISVSADVPGGHLAAVDASA